MEEEYWRASKLDRENRVGACVAIGTTLVEKFVVRQVVAIKWHSIPWCTHVCKCTVHQALGSITIPAVSARFIVRVSDLHGCELAPCISRSIAGINATHFSAIFLLLEIQVLPGKRKGMEERRMERATRANPYPRMRSSTKFPETFTKEWFPRRTRKLYRPPFYDLPPSLLNRYPILNRD